MHIYVHISSAILTVIWWIVRRTLSYNLVAIMKAATALIVVSSPCIVTP